MNGKKRILYVIASFRIKVRPEIEIFAVQCVIYPFKYGIRSEKKEIHFVAFNCILVTLDELVDVYLSKEVAYTNPAIPNLTNKTNV